MIMRKLFLVITMFFISLVARSQESIGGHVFEQDGVTPIRGAEVTFSGISMDGDTLDVSFSSDSVGYFGGQIAEGRYFVSLGAEGYQTAYLIDSLLIMQGQVYVDLVFLLYECYYPVHYVSARSYSDDMVRVSWSMNEPRLTDDFESGDFSRFRWDNTLSDSPWEIDSIHAFEGSYCMKSSCVGIDEGRSEIEVSVFVPWSGQMSFVSKVSSENLWDVGLFYIDGTQMFECSGFTDWEPHYFDITAGEHVFRWAYHKDANTNEGDDCFYVDDIHFYVADSLRTERSFQYFDLLRKRFDEQPVLLASHLTDTVFMDLNWGSLDWGKYCWGVCCHYEGNRAASDTVWSAYLDKNMTTRFEANVTTNVGLSAEGASLTLVPNDGQGVEYHSVADANGHVIIGNVYRNLYSVRIILDGFVDYVSDSLVSVMEPTLIEVELREAVKGIDSLYVSSTGWAVWELSDTLYKNLQYFELQLNNELVGFTDERFFQFDVSGLTPGDTCTAKVRPIYLSDTCDWREWQWVYRSCADFQPTIEGLQTSISEHGIMLSWQQPDGDTVIGALLYRNGALLAWVEGMSFFDESVEMQGVVTYALRLVYGGDGDGTYYSMSCEESVEVSFPAYCDPPTKLVAENYLDGNGEYGALISWGDRPEPVEGWLYYDNGEYKNSLGGGDEPVIFWAIRFDAEDLADYQGTSLKKITIFDVASGAYQLWVYRGGETAPHTLVRSQNMVLTGAQAWHSETIEPAMEIPENEPIWIVIGQQGVSRPAAVCADMDEPDGRWVSLNGVDWTDLHTFNMHYTWMLRAFVSDRMGRDLPMENGGYTLRDFNVYRSYNNVDYQKIASVTAVDGQAFYQYRDVQVGESHHEFYYRLTAVYLSEDNEECESDFATALHNPEQNYVWIDDEWSVNDEQEEGLLVYPNPARDKLFVEANGLGDLLVVNALGQLVMSMELNSETIEIDLSNWADGVYLLRVGTKTGVSSLRFIVSH